MNSGVNSLIAKAKTRMVFQNLVYLDYLSFKDSIANTTHINVTIQKRVAILLS